MKNLQCVLVVGVSLLVSTSVSFAGKYNELKEPLLGSDFLAEEEQLTLFGPTEGAADYEQSGHPSPVQLGKPMEDPSGSLSPPLASAPPAPQVVFLQQEFERLLPVERKVFLRNSLDSLSEISHGDCFRILSQMSVEDQDQVYLQLVKKISPFDPLTSTDLALGLDGVTPRIVAFHSVRYGDPFAFLAQRRHPRSTRFLKHVIEFGGPLSSDQLVFILGFLAEQMTPASSEKQLLHLRDLLRQFSLKEWTAFDLFFMNVPVNIDLALRAILKTPSIQKEHEAAVLGLAQTLWSQASSLMHEIHQNPRKKHLPSPAKRGIRLSVLKSLFEQKFAQAGSR